MVDSSPSPRRVVCTGIGVISPLGLTKEALWDALSTGRSGVAPLSTAHGRWALPVPFAAQASDFHGEIDDFGPLPADIKKTIRKGLKVMCRECQMGVAAAQRALSDAGLTGGNHDPERCGVVFGADYMVSDPNELSAGIRACLAADEHFEFVRWGQEGMRQMSPLWLLKYLPNMPASHVAIYNDFRGPNNSLTQREAAGNLAAAEAFRVIQRRHADVILVGATGTRVHPMKAVQTALYEELAGNGAAPAEAARPFDLDRSGMVLGEGAGAVVLEDLDHALARGATIYGEVVGAGSSSVATRGVARRRQALAQAMQAALRDAGLAPDQVGHVHAHGLSTRTSDAEEAQAIREVLGPAADRVPVTAAKSFFGNLGAGSGLVELGASLMALARGALFPVLNFRTPDPECPVLVCRTGDTPAGESFLNLSVTPQGQASCLLVRRWGG